MTVSAIAPAISYVGNANTTNFAIPFSFIDSSHLSVSLNGVALSGGFSVVGSNVVFTVAPAVGAKVQIRRKTPRTQPMDYTANDTFPAESHEAALDRVVLIAQEVDGAQKDLEHDFDGLTEELRLKAAGTESKAHAALLAAQSAGASVAAIAAALAAALSGHDVQSLAIPVESRAMLSALPPSAGAALLLEEGYRGPPFVWDPTNHSTGEVAMVDTGGTTVTNLGDGWYDIRKTGGVDGQRDADATGAPIAGAAAMLIRRGARSCGEIWLGFDPSPPASGVDSDLIRLSFNASFTGFYGYGLGSSIGSTNITPDSRDWLVYRRPNGTVSIYSWPRRVALKPSLLDAQLAALIAAGQAQWIANYTNPSNGPISPYVSLSGINTCIQVKPIDIGNGGTGLVAIDETEGGYIKPPASDPTGKSGAWVRQLEAKVSPAWMGMAANPTRALRSASALVSYFGGGVFEMPKGGYGASVGEQRPQGFSDTWAFAPRRIVYFGYCPGAVEVIGNGSYLTLKGGGKYGAFHNLTGEWIEEFGNEKFKSTPAEAIIHFEFCTGGISVRDLRLDGFVTGQVIGGRTAGGAEGRQIQCDGVRIYESNCAVSIQNVHANNFCFDGFDIRTGYIDKDDEPHPLSMDRCKAKGNTRQGLSLIGGRAVTISNSLFCDTGKTSEMYTNPRAGIDFEPDGFTGGFGYLDQVTLINVRCINNAGVGLGWATGRLSDIVLIRCLLVGTTAPPLQVNKPGFVAIDTVIVGAAQLQGANGAASGGADDLVPNEPGREYGLAPKFVRCRFSDDPTYHSSGQVYIPVEDFTQNYTTGAWYIDCHFDFQNGMKMHGTNQACTFVNARMFLTEGGHQTGTNCNFLGETVMDGPGGTWASFTYARQRQFKGVVKIAGVQQFVATPAHDFGLVNDGAVVEAVFAVPGAHPNDGRTYSIQGLPPNLFLDCPPKVTAAEQVKIYAKARGGNVPAGLVNLSIEGR